MIIVFHTKHRRYLNLVRNLNTNLSTADIAIDSKYLKVLGYDNYGNILIYLNYGRNKKLYFRAIDGILHLFKLRLEYIDIDEIIKITLRQMPLPQKFIVYLCPTFAANFSLIINALLRELKKRQGDTS